jgi:signal transduction histidine kinase
VTGAVAVLTHVSSTVEVTAGTVAGAALIGAALGLIRTSARAAGALVIAGVLAMATRSSVGDVAYVMLLVVAFELGRRDRSWVGVGVLIAIVAASELGAVLHQDSNVAPFLYLAPSVWGAGRALREHQVTTGRLAERARELDEEREAFAELSVRYERARIASELHDIVAHAMSVMVVQASAGQRLAAVDPQRTADTFEIIAEAARQAEQDMQRLVTLLADERAVGQAPDLTLVEELVQRAAGSGLDVTLRLGGEREGLAAASVELAYRVVRESITNALRYASGAAVRVRIEGAGDDLLVEVSNSPAPASQVLAGQGTGNGLRGLRERVGAIGGRFDAGPTADGGWLVGARLPRRARVAGGTHSSD